MEDTLCDSGWWVLIYYTSVIAVAGAAVAAAVYAAVHIDHLVPNLQMGKTYWLEHWKQMDQRRGIPANQRLLADLPPLDPCRNSCHGTVIDPSLLCQLHLQRPSTKDH